MIDHWGHERLGGYNIEDYEICPNCKGRKEPNPNCKLCGGYGDIPKGSGPTKTSSYFLRESFFILCMIILGCVIVISILFFKLLLKSFY